MKRIHEFQDFIGEQETDIIEFDETLVKRLLQQMTAYQDHFTVEFKSSVRADITK